jgi:hypothetical protein
MAPALAPSASAICAADCSTGSHTMSHPSTRPVIRGKPAACDNQVPQASMNGQSSSSSGLTSFTTY